MNNDIKFSIKNIGPSIGANTVVVFEGLDDVILSGVYVSSGIFSDNTWYVGEVVEGGSMDFQCHASLKYSGPDATVTATVSSNTMDPRLTNNRIEFKIGTHSPGDGVIATRESGVWYGDNGTVRIYNSPTEFITIEDYNVKGYELPVVDGKLITIVDGKLSSIAPDGTDTLEGRGPENVEQFYFSPSGKTLCYVRSIEATIEATVVKFPSLEPVGNFEFFGDVGDYVQPSDDYVLFAGKLDTDFDAWEGIHLYELSSDSIHRIMHNGATTPKPAWGIYDGIVIYNFVQNFADYAMINPTTGDVRHGWIGVEGDHWKDHIDQVGSSSLFLRNDFGTQSFSIFDFRVGDVVKRYESGTPVIDKMGNVLYLQRRVGGEIPPTFDLYLSVIDGEDRLIRTDVFGATSGGSFYPIAKKNALLW